MGSNILYSEYMSRLWEALLQERVEKMHKLGLKKSWIQHNTTTFSLFIRKLFEFCLKNHRSTLQKHTCRVYSSTTSMWDTLRLLRLERNGNKDCSQFNRQKCLMFTLKAGRMSRIMVSWLLLGLGKHIHISSFSLMIVVSPTPFSKSAKYGNIIRKCWTQYRFFQPPKSYVFSSFSHIRRGDAEKGHGHLLRQLYVTRMYHLLNRKCGTLIPSSL